ncbi:tRNA (cytosine(38)-C(5))-methyltransferase [Echinococcus granulosus]|nr:tRNA (cytosine(38)-C(5))-methyltransferase [Echinococcus granulosus]
MSPPCQPFTRTGNQKRGKDTRCSSLLIIIQLIRRIKPPAVILENVKGFEGSDAWRIILEALIACDYDVRQFLLTPLQFGIPNCRLRYYLVARLRTHSKQRMFSFGTSVDDLKGSFEELASAVIRTPPCDVSPMPNCECVVCTNKVGGIASTENHFLEYIPFCRPIADYLLPECEIPETCFWVKMNWRSTTLSWTLLPQRTEKAPASPRATHNDLRERVPFWKYLSHHIAIRRLFPR